MATSIKFKFMPSGIEGKPGVVCLQLIHNRQVRLIRTRFRLFAGEWDGRRSAVISGHTGIERQACLQSIRTGMEATMKQLCELIRLLEQKGDYTVEELAGLYAHNSFSGYFSPFADYTVQTLRDANRPKTATILLTAKTSFERFLTSTLRLRSVTTPVVGLQLPVGGQSRTMSGSGASRNAPTDHAPRDILIERIDGDLMRSYENWLKTTGLTKNTVACYMRALRSLYNQAVARYLTVQKNPFARIVTNIDKTVKRAVSEDVLLRLKTIDLSACSELALARDLLMFSFYMRGISFIDMANLRKNNVKNGYILYSRSKTRQLLTVKLEPCMQQIIARYATQTVDDYLLPVYTALNRCNTSRLRTYNKQLRRIAGMLGLDTPLSSYVARHTWATLALRRGIPVEVISESMGHENETTTRIYLASLNQSVVDEANEKIIKLN
jgi:integrase